jgi:hypothetical protein
MRTKRSGRTCSKITAQELVGLELEDFLAIAVTVILIEEAHTFAVERDDPAFGAGDAVGIRGQIAQDLARTAEGAFGIDDPLLGRGLHEKIFNVLDAGAERRVIAQRLSEHLQERRRK